MKFATFFFSGTGNTWWAVKTFSELAIAAGHEAVYYSIEKSKVHEKQFLQQVFSSSDAVGIAYPIYGSTLPSPMWDFIDELSAIEKESAITASKVGYTITTMALFSGDGALVPRKRMKKAGLVLRGAVNICMASNLSVPYFHYNPVKSEKLEKRKIRGRKKLQKLLTRLSNGNKYLEGRNPLLIFVGWIQRISLNYEIEKISKYFGINYNTCTKCMLCVDNCPTQTLKFENDTFSFNKGCAACLRCYNMCPAYSIKMFNKVADPKKYRRFRGPGEGFNVKLLRD
jgi:NAD-dependent dihydropyrimidine dehydrogenase PreA subunit